MKRVKWKISEVFSPDTDGKRILYGRGELLQIIHYPPLPFYEGPVGEYGVIMGDDSKLHKLHIELIFGDEVFEENK